MPYRIEGWLDIWRPRIMQTLMRLSKRQKSFHLGLSVGIGVIAERCYPQRLKIHTLPLPALIPQQPILLVPPQQHPTVVEELLQNWVAVYGAFD